MDVCVRGFPGGPSGKEAACQCRGHKETRVQFPGGENLMVEGTATHSGILQLKNPMDRGAW